MVWYDIAMIGEYENDLINNVIPLQGLRRVERLDGIKYSLGTMGYAGLMDLYTKFRATQEAASMQADIVGMYMDTRFPEGPGLDGGGNVPPSVA